LDPAAPQVAVYDRFHTLRNATHPHFLQDCNNGCTAVRLLSVHAPELSVCIHYSVPSAKYAYAWSRACDVSYEPPKNTPREHHKTAHPSTDHWPKTPTISSRANRNKPTILACHELARAPHPRPLSSGTQSGPALRLPIATSLQTQSPIRHTYRE
jgi:hypothetical protein